MRIAQPYGLVGDGDTQVLHRLGGLEILALKMVLETFCDVLVTRRAWQFTFCIPACHCQSGQLCAVRLLCLVTVFAGDRCQLQDGDAASVIFLCRHVGVWSVVARTWSRGHKPVLPMDLIYTDLHNYVLYTGPCCCPRPRE